MMTPTATETVAATFTPLRKVYSRMNYDQFCAALGLTALTGTGAPDAYSEGKWFDFRDLMKAYDHLGTLMPKLVAAGEAL